jgi:hypothetical protein
MMLKLFVASTLFVAACQSSAPAPAPTTPAQPATPTTPTAPAKPSAAGPFSTIASYCERTTTELTQEACHRYGGNDCFCEQATADHLQGPLEATGTGLVKSATLVRTARSVAAYVKCELAVRLERGWYFHRETFPCGPAPAGSGEGHGSELKIKSFTVRGDTVDLAWTTQYAHPDYSDPDGPPKLHVGPLEHHALRCKVVGEGSVACDSPK